MCPRCGAPAYEHVDKAGWEEAARKEKAEAEEKLLRLRLEVAKAEAAGRGAASSPAQAQATAAAAESVAEQPEGKRRAWTPRPALSADEWTLGRKPVVAVSLKRAAESYEAAARKALFAAKGGHLSPLTDLRLALEATAPMVAKVAAAAEAAIEEAVESGSAEADLTLLGLDKMPLAKAHRGLGMWRAAMECGPEWVGKLEEAVLAITATEAVDCFGRFTRPEAWLWTEDRLSAAVEAFLAPVQAQLKAASPDLREETWLPLSGEDAGGVPGVLCLAQAKQKGVGATLAFAGRLQGVLTTWKAELQGSLKEKLDVDTLTYRAQLLGKRARGAEDGRLIVEAQLGLAGPSTPAPSATRGGGRRGRGGPNPARGGRGRASPGRGPFPARGLRGGRGATPGRGGGRGQPNAASPATPGGRKALDRLAREQGICHTFRRSGACSTPDCRFKHQEVQK